MALRLLTAVTDAISHLEDARALWAVCGRAYHPISSGWRNNQLTDDHRSLRRIEIVPLLGGGQLLRCSVIPDGQGIVVALGGEPIELVVATDMSLQFLQVTETPNYLFRVYEKLALRIKSTEAVVRLTDKDADA